MATQKIPFPDLNLSQETILSEMGYGEVVPESSVKEIVEELYLLMEKNVIAEYAFKICKGQMLSKSIMFDDIELETGETITPLLENSILFAFFAATAGLGFDTIMQKIKTESDILKVYILDTIGTCIAEKAGEIMEIHLENEISDYSHTNRFSPGYCSWPLIEQRKIFYLLENESCGITLSEVCLMHPIKSISGIIGIGHNVNRKLYGCYFCELKTCYKRKKLHI